MPRICPRLPRDLGQIRVEKINQSRNIIKEKDSYTVSSHFQIGPTSKSANLVRITQISQKLSRQLWDPDTEECLSKQTFSHVLIISLKKVNPYLLNMAGLEDWLKPRLAPGVKKPQFLSIVDLIGCNLEAPASGWPTWDSKFPAWQNPQSLKRWY